MRVKCRTEVYNERETTKVRRLFNINNAAAASSRRVKQCGCQKPIFMFKCVFTSTEIRQSTVREGEGNYVVNA